MLEWGGRGSECGVGRRGVLWMKGGRGVGRRWSLGEIFGLE